MATSTPHRDHDTTELVDRYERERVVERPAYTTPASASNVNVGPTTAVVARNDAVWAVTRIVTLLITVLEVVLVLRFFLKLFGANANQPLVSGLYRITEPLDEWVNSPVGPGSRVELRSGMALQVDIIPATGTEYFTTNIEDGIALADESMRRAFATQYPAAWQRTEKRRRFMTEVLGIELHPDVLPFSNIPAWLPPFLLAPGSAMTLG